MYYIGDKLDYDNLNITFLVDENLENYRDTWLVNRSRFTKDYVQFRNLQNAGSDRYSYNYKYRFK